MKIVGIIPARRGSKGLPGKNLRLLAGKPLLAHTLLAAIHCGLFSEIVVTTEDNEIASISEEYGARVILRPEALARDQTKMEEVVEHALLTWSPLPEHFALLQPTSPLRTTVDISKAIGIYFEGAAHCVISVTEAEHHPYKYLERQGEVVTPLFGVEHLSVPRQTLPKIYRQNGAIYVLRTESFLKHRAFFLPPVTPYVMPLERSVDIDSTLDLLLCSALLG